MKPVEQIRTENLATLIRDKFGEQRGAKTAFAKAIGWTPGLISRYLAGKRIDSGLARKLELAGGKPTYWLDQDHAARTSEPVQPYLLHEVEQHERFYHIPLNDRQLSAGGGIYNLPEPARGSIAFRKDYMDSEGLDVKALETWFVQGDSMERILFHGDLVVVNTAIKTIIDGEMYAFFDAKEKGGGGRIKYIHEQRDGSLMLLSENAAKYPPEPVPAGHRGDIEIVGLVELRSGRIRKSR